MLKNARAIDNIIVNRDDPGGDYESPQTGTTAEEVMEYFLAAFIGGAYAGNGCGSRDGPHFSYMYIGGNFSPHVMKSAEKLKCMPVLGLEGVQYVYGFSKAQKVEVWLPEGKREAVQYDLIAKTTHKLAAGMQDHLSFTTPSSKAVMTVLTNLKRVGGLTAAHN